MRMEESYTSKFTCPCGKGLIYQVHYEGVDWSSYEDGPVTIDCPECSSNYKIEEESRSGLLRSDYRKSAYYLTPKNYPDYDGPSITKTFTRITYTNENFSDWLIENYSKETLTDVLSQIDKVSSSSKLVGIAAEIRKIHKSALGSVRLGNIRNSVEKAIKTYESYDNGTYYQRLEIHKEEINAQALYKEEKRKHQILIDFDR